MTPAQLLAASWRAATILAASVDREPDPDIQAILAWAYLPVLTAGRLVAITLGLDPLCREQ